VALSGASDVAVHRALFSVHDPSGLVDLSRGLADLGVELIATSGTRRTMAAGGVTARPAEELTGIGSWFSGRIKTLHPGILGGILAPRTPEGIAELAQRGLLSIDLVVVNLYPFVEHLREVPNAADKEEFIDIGGVTLMRAAAKNHAFVAILSDPGEYPEVLDELRRTRGTLSGATRARLAVRAFERTAAYDRAIADGLATTPGAGVGFPRDLTFTLDPMALKYGDNPHQKAAVYRASEGSGGAFPPHPFDVLKGAGLSYTNFLDLDAALSIVGEFPGPAAAVVKHGSPCGVACGLSAREAIARAIATDPVARYGCGIAVNRPVAEGDPDTLKGVFVDILAAPAYDAAALAQLAKRPKIRIVRADPPSPDRPRWEARSALGRVLVQEADRRQLGPSELRLVTGRAASPHELASLEFAWRVVRHARSNAIVLADGLATVGIGSGQPSRVKSAEIAVGVAGERARGSVLASDAFFPFADGVEVAGRAGVRAILQPGGSIRDADVLATAEKYGIAMYYTGWRAFRH
jgi:phosphoribosylaminoimidazolecarboxamide formyltransferase/IMP cyclohydrolase